MSNISLEYHKNLKNILQYQIAFVWLANIKTHKTFKVQAKKLWKLILVLRLLIRLKKPITQNCLCSISRYVLLVSRN